MPGKNRGLTPRIKSAAAPIGADRNSNSITKLLSSHPGWRPDRLKRATTGR